MVTTIRLPDELHGKLKAEAERKGMTFNAYVLSLLWDMQECRSNNEVEDRQVIEQWNGKLGIEK